jgi:tetratricopeptide (TPR) repeat protein
LRGLNPDPADRYENIGALLRDLERHTVDNRRRLVFWSAGAAAAMAAGVVGLGAARVDPDLCREGTEKITQVWNSATKESIASSFAAVDTPYATHMWATVERHLGGYAEQWAAMYQDACEATRVHGVQSTELLDRRMACLHERFETFSILTDRLRSADEATVPLAIDAVAALDPVAECDLVSTRGAPALAMGEGDDPSIEAGKREVRTATVERRLGHYETAREAAIRATHIARAAQDRGLEAAAFRALGLAELSRARYEASRDAFEQAVRAALATQQYGEAAVISASLAESLAQLTKLDAAATAIGQAQALAEGIQMTSRDLAFIHAAAGSVLHDQGEYEQALEHQLRAVEFTRGEVPLFASANLYELAFGYYNVGQYNAALETIRETIQLRQELFGPRHPLYGHSLMLLGMILEELEQFEEAERAHEEALDIYLAVYDGPHLNIGLALNNRGNILRKTGRAAAAHELYIRALEIFEQQTNRFMIAMANLNLGTTSLSLERYPQAVEHLSTAIEMTEQDLGVNHRNLAAPLEYLGKTRIAQGRAIEAIAPLERAVAIRLAHIDSTDLSTLANAELLLSEALWTVHREPERAKVLARSARSRLAADVEKYPQRSKRDLEAAQAWLDDLERVVP